MSRRETRSILRKRELRDKYDQIHEVFHMEDMDIDNGIWEDEEGNHKVLSLKKIQLIKRLREWNSYMRHKKKTMVLINLDIPWGDPTVINEDSFLEFTEKYLHAKENMRGLHIRATIHGDI